MYFIQQNSTATPLKFLLVNTADHITGTTGISAPTVTLSKNGSSFAAAGGSTTEIANGWYKILPSSVDCNTLGPLALHASSSLSDPTDIIVAQVVAFNPADAVHLGLTCLPNTAVTTNGSIITSGAGTDQLTVSGGLASADAKKINAVSTSNTTAVNSIVGTSQIITFDSNAFVKSDLRDILGTAVSAPATAGILDVNAKNFNNVSTSNTTAIAANLGTSQIITFDANAFVKSDLRDILGTAVSTPATAGILDVNAKNINNVSTTNTTAINSVIGSSQTLNFSGTGASAFVKADVEQINTQATSATATVAFPGTVASPTNITAGTIATVSGNVNGSVGSVVGAVGSVTGNVGGNVVGSVASVTAGVTVTTNNDKIGYGVTSNRKKGSTATFEFLMQDATTGAPKTGLSPTSTITKDGGASAGTTNAVTEIGLGQYQIVLTATEMTANNVFLQFIAAGAITYSLSIQTQP